MADQEFRSTPEKYPTVGALSRLLGRVDKFARAPFGYSNPPVEMLSDLLEIPALYRTGENIAYGSPLTIGAGQARRMTEDTTGAIGGALNLIGPAASTAKLAVKGAKAAAPRAGMLAQQLAERTQPMPLQMNIVKPKGGNWLAGAVEDELRPLRMRTDGSDPERYLKGLEAAYAQNVEAGIGDAAAFDRQRARLAPDIAINKWIDNKLSKYIKNEMGTPEDPVRALAEEGILHYQPRQMAENSTFMDIVKEKRAFTGSPVEDTATTPLGKLWERYADYSIFPRPAGQRLSENKSLTRNFSNVQPVEEANPWLLKVPPETQVYELSNYSDFAGFPHLVDELKAAVNPASEVPEHLRLTVEQLDKVTVPQAVKRVAEINAWRAKQAAEAEKQGLMANLQATPRLKDESMQLSFVEKPGATWVDVPETVTEDGVKLCTSLGKAGGWCTQNEGLAKSYGSGSNRLTTLIDAEGRPHAQAKITQDKDQFAAVEDASEHMTPEQELAYDEHFGQLDRPPELEESLDWIKENAPQAYKTYEDALANQPASVPNIEELKPPGNSFTSERSTEYLRRDPDYKAKVADSVLKFLNSGTWGKVNDLQHYDIADLKDSNSITNAINNLYPGDFQKGADAFNMAADMEPNTPRFMSKSQLREFIEPSTKPEGFAKGGLVEYDPDHIESLAQGLHMYESEEGLAPHGLRHAGDSVKGKGYYGLIPARGGRMSTEISAEDAEGEFPLLVPGLTSEEIESLTNEEYPESAYKKAVAHAQKRRSQNKSPFSGIDELRYPRPSKFASGGAVNYNQSHIDELAAQFHKEM